MTKDQLITQLLEFPDDTRIWVDTDQGLMELDYIYLDTTNKFNTAIIVYTESQGEVCQTKQ